MRHSFRPAPVPMKANGKVANGHAPRDLTGSNPFAETAPSRLAAAKALGDRGLRNASISGSSVASSEADEAELGRDIYQDLASLVHGGKNGCLSMNLAALCLPSETFASDRPKPRMRGHGAEV